MSAPRIRLDLEYFSCVIMRHGEFFFHEGDEFGHLDGLQPLDFVGIERYRPIRVRGGFGFIG